MEMSVRKAESNRIRKPMLSLEQRFEIAQHLESGVSTRRLAAEFDIHPSTVRRIRQTSHLVTQFLEEGTGRTKRRNLRKPVHQELDNRLYAWVLERQSHRLLVTDTIITHKAMEISKELGGTSDFKASRGWLWGFKNRHRIRTYVYSQKADPNTAIAQEFADRFVRQIEDEGIEYENIYNMNEISLVWNALPLKTNVQWNDRSVKVGKPNKDRVTVGFCTNATGSHKHTPLFINRYESPRVLKHAKHKLAVIYKSHEDAMMDQKLFTDWYENHFKPDVMNYQLQLGTCGKVILLLDNSRVYTVEIFEQFKNDERFQIILLPPHTNHLIQPIDILISKVKESYHEKISNRMENFSDRIDNFYANYDLKDCINFLHEAWSEIDTAVIREAWRSLIKEIPEGMRVEQMGDFFEFDQCEMKDSAKNKGAEPINTIKFVSGGPATDVGLKISEVRSLSNVGIDDEKISRAFTTLMLWSRQESKMIEFNIKCLRNYYYEQR